MTRRAVVCVSWDVPLDMDRTFEDFVDVITQLRVALGKAMAEQRAHTACFVDLPDDPAGTRLWAHINAQVDAGRV